MLCRTLRLLMSPFEKGTEVVNVPIEIMHPFFKTIVQRRLGNFDKTQSMCRLQPPTVSRHFDSVFIWFLVIFLRSSRFSYSTILTLYYLIFKCFLRKVTTVFHKVGSLSVKCPFANLSFESRTFNRKVCTFLRG